MTKAIEFNGEKLTKYLKQRGITKKGLSQEMGRTIDIYSEKQYKYCEEHYNYCPTCGQRLDWSTEVE